MRSVRVTIFVVEKQKVLHNLTVCLWRSVSSMQRERVVLYCRLWPVGLYNIFPHYLINDKILGKMLSETFLILRRTEMLLRV
jgi:hypothetical protein